MESMNKITLNLKNLDEVSRLAAETISKGGIVIAPFDTVYGIIGNVYDDRVIERIFDFKNRDRSQTLGIATDSINTIGKLTELNDQQLDFIEKRTPGKYTFIVNLSQNNISRYCQKDGTVAFRIPDSKLILQIAILSGGTVAQTSANKNGQPNCFSFSDLEQQFSIDELDQIDLIIDDGQIPSTGASTIADLTKDKITVVER